MAKVALTQLERLSIENLLLQETIARERHEAATAKKLDFYKALLVRYEVEGTATLTSDCTAIEWEDRAPPASMRVPERKLKPTKNNRHKVA